jgi:hypothetical protein
LDNPPITLTSQNLRTSFCSFQAISYARIGVVAGLDWARCSNGKAQRKLATTIPRYQPRMPEVNEAIVATYLAGGNTRGFVSKSAVSRVVATLKDGLEP